MLSACHILRGPRSPWHPSTRAQGQRQHENEVQSRLEGTGDAYRREASHKVTKEPQGFFPLSISPTIFLPHDWSSSVKCWMILLDTQLLIFWLLSLHIISCVSQNLHNDLFLLPVYLSVFECWQCCHCALTLDLSFIPSCFILEHMYFTVFTSRICSWPHRH